MDTLMSLPMTASVLTEYGDLEEACRSCGCDGLEVVWGGEELPCTVPQALHVGYHLTFYPDWLDFWRGDRAALTEKFGSEEVWRSFYGGPEGRETLLRLYREDLDRAVTWGARYVVFHVSDVSVEEGFTYHWRHTHEEVIDAAAEVINLLLGDRAWPFDFLVENQWWPGFTFTEPELTRRLLELDRGVTLLQGKGAYSGRDKQVILCACARTQIIPVKRAVQEIDPDAFVIVCDAHEILGEGFGVYAPGGL